MQGPLRGLLAGAAAWKFGGGTHNNVREITVKQGDSLRKLARQYNVSAEKLMELNPTITRWTMIQIGQKILVPAASPKIPQLRRRQTRPPRVLSRT